MARIAIGIPCFNEESFIAGTLISALQQAEHASDIEILVSDNASDDATVERIEGVLQAMPSNAHRVRLLQQRENLGVEANFWRVFDGSDSEFFLWLGAHDQISKDYVSRGLEHLQSTPETSMFCGRHKTMAVGGEVTDQPIFYDFNQENPIERYLKSILELNNCYIFHSIFRREALHDYERTPTPSPDHILISRHLWKGKLWQSEECHYIRRYFSKEKRQANSMNHHYVHGQNNIDFYEAHLNDLMKLASELPSHVQDMILHQAAEALVKRFGLPFSK